MMKVLCYSELRRYKTFEERFKLVYDRELTVDDVKDYTNHLEEATKLYNRLYKK